MKTKINVNGITEKTSAKGKTYWVVNTNEGGLTCFEENIIEIVKQNLGKEITIEMKEANGFKNIRGLYPNEVTVIDEKFEAPVKKTITPTPNQSSSFSDTKNASIYASYAKDLIISGMPEDEAISLVKRLLGAFTPRSD
jgi:hypothetical protein